jgi:hypothetical protein
LPKERRRTSSVEPHPQCFPSQVCSCHLAQPLLQFLALSRGQCADYVGSRAAQQPGESCAIRLRPGLEPQQMTHLALQPAARRGDSVDMILRYGPAAAAFAYPFLLMLLHRSGRQLAEATTATAILSAGLGVGAAAALIVGVPLIAFVAIQRSFQLQTRRLAHLAFAAPPLFNVTGVLFFLLGIPNGEYAAWPVFWAGALVYAARTSSDNGTATARTAGWIRTAHGLSASIIIAVFVIWHLGNHVVALWSLDQNKAVMDVLRLWYRSNLVQPLLVTLLLWQVFSGLRLLWAKLPSAGDVYSSIQTATAAYLAVYVPGHLFAVLVLGRLVFAVDTTFSWASGAPTGLLLDPWSVRLIPHYSLGVLFLVSHLAVGRRAILLGHGVCPITAARTTWSICAFGLALSLAIVVAQLRVGI